jgi:hypothetical protein
MESLDVFVGGAECIGPPRHIRGMGGILGRLVAGGAPRLWSRW